MNDISYTIIEAIANVACDKSCSEKAKAYRIEALNSIHQQICFYQKEGFTDFLIEAIAQKKCDIAATITTKEEAEKIKKIQPPHYNGNRFSTNPYSCPEEELIGWSLTSLKAPLSQAGFRRYKELFCQIFPKDIAKTVFEDQTEGM